MKIAIYGGGRIGSTFALQLARAGHEVTVVARGQRLEELQRDGGIVPLQGERAAVKAAAALDAATPWDLVLVTVMPYQLEPVLPQLKSSAAKAVMFMFNTVAALEPVRDAVGADRAVFAFPMVTAAFVDGKLKSAVAAPGNVTTVGSETWRKVFAEAGIPSAVEPDMQSYLRSHAAWVLPLMALGGIVFSRGRGPTWAEARRAVEAMRAAFRVVKKLGHQLMPGFAVALAALPAFVLTPLFWLFGRTRALKELGSFGPTELQHLIDGLCALGPEDAAPLRAIRPG